MDALFISATGMQAQQTQVETIANNLANLNTIGFKKSHVSFEPLLPQATVADATLAGAVPAYKGMGAAAASVQPDFAPGELKQTQRDLDLAIRGQGFFEIELPDGTHGYSRHGALNVNQEGALVTASGLALSAAVSVPRDAESVMMTADGRVQVKYLNSDELTDVGQLELAQFANPNALKSIGDNLFIATENSGEALYSRPGENGLGTLAQGYLEASNVQMVEELTSLMAAQRAYEANSKVLQASDELLGIINNLRR